MKKSTLLSLIATPIIFAGVISPVIIAQTYKKHSLHSYMKDNQVPQDRKYDKYKTYNVLQTQDYKEEATKLVNDAVVAYRGGLVEAIHYINQNTDINATRRTVEEFYVKPLLENFNKYINQGYDADYFASVMSERGTTYYDWRNNLIDICTQANSYDNAGLVTEALANSTYLNYESKLLLNDLIANEEFKIGADVTDIVSSYIYLYDQPLSRDSFYNNGREYGIAAILNDFDTKTGNIDLRLFTYTSYDFLTLMLDDEQILNLGGVPFNFNASFSPVDEKNECKAWLKNTELLPKDNTYIDDFCGYYLEGDTIVYSEIYKYFEFEYSEDYILDARCVKINENTNEITLSFNVSKTASIGLFDKQERILTDDYQYTFLLNPSPELLELVEKKILEVNDILDFYTDEKINAIQYFVGHLTIYIDLQWTFFALNTALSIAYFASSFISPWNVANGVLCAVGAGLSLASAILSMQQREEIEKQISKMISYKESDEYFELKNEYESNVISYISLGYSGICNMVELCRKFLKNFILGISNGTTIGKATIKSICRVTTKQIENFIKISKTISILSTVLNAAEIAVELWWIIDQSHFGDIF